VIRVRVVGGAPTPKGVIPLLGRQAAPQAVGEETSAPQPVSVEEPVDPSLPLGQAGGVGGVSIRVVPTPALSR